MKNVDSPLYKKYPEDAGQDLRTSEFYELKPGDSHFFHTGISIQIPRGCVGLIRPRSGLAYKYQISTLAGVIDSNYRGEVLVGLINLGKQPYIFKAGDRIAQLLILETNIRKSKLVESLDDETDRSNKGFGHTGI